MDPSPSYTAASYFADFGLIFFALFLVLLNGFFVAAEFAMVKLRATKVEAIAQQLGYAESAAFIHAFQRWAGMTPSAFRGR